MSIEQRHAHRKSILIFYILLFYILIQIAWWVFQVLSLANQLDNSGGLVASKVKMITGEFAVFIILVGIGVYWIHKVFKKELGLARRKKNFALSVTHELKTPIASSKLFLETLTQRELPREKEKEVIQKVLKEQDRLQILIDKILLSSRLENADIELNKEKVQLNKFIEDVITSTRAVGFTSIDIPKTHYIDVDTFYWKSVCNNLIENAIKYSEGEPKIEIRSVDKNQDFIEIQFSDNGIGIKKEQQSSIFEMFQRIENEETKTVQGTGLGLYLVKKIVDLHKGTISVQSEPQKGTTFAISIAKSKK